MVDFIRSSNDHELEFLVHLDIDAIGSDADVCLHSSVEFSLEFVEDVIERFVNRVEAHENQRFASRQTHLDVGNDLQKLRDAFIGGESTTADHHCVLRQQLLGHQRFLGVERLVADVEHLTRVSRVVERTHCHNLC